MSGKGGLDHGRSATHPGFHFDRTWFTVQLAGTAFNAGIAVDQPGYLFTSGKNILGADNGTHPAIGAQFRVVE